MEGGIDSLQLLAQAVPVVALCLVVLITLWKHHLSVLSDKKSLEKHKHEMDLENLSTLKDVASAIEANSEKIVSLEKSVVSGFNNTRDAIKEKKS